MARGPRRKRPTGPEPGAPATRREPAVSASRRPLATPGPAPTSPFRITQDRCFQSEPRSGRGKPPAPHGSGERGPHAAHSGQAEDRAATSPRRGRAPALSWPAKALGADTTLVSSLSPGAQKGESLKDTGLTSCGRWAPSGRGPAQLIRGGMAAGGGRRRCGHQRERRHARASHAGAAWTCGRSSRARPSG